MSRTVSGTARQERQEWKERPERMETLEPSDAEKRRILRERARELARPVLAPASRGEEVEVVEFLLADERYAVESSHVREVHALREHTPLPCVPAFVVGIMNVRGQIVSITDVRRLFDLPESPATAQRRVIVVRGLGPREPGAGSTSRGGAPGGPMELGILVDAVVGVRSVALAELQPPPPTLTGSRAEYLRGVTPDRLALLDVARLLADRRIVVRDEVEV